MRTSLLVALLITASSARAQECPTGTWPTATWSRAEQVATSKAEAIRALESYAFTLTGEDAERTGIRTDGVVIVQHGVLVYERYARGFAGNNRHLAWSMSKSVINALVGIAVQRRALNLQDSICDHVQVRGDACQITVQHLLEFSSGFDWKETYEGESPTVSSVVAMLYGEGFADMAGFVASHPLRDPPGDTWMYSSGDTTLLAAVVQSALDDDDFRWTLLFDPIGIDSATFERDGRGHYVGSSAWYATPRDMARFGHLFAKDGCWGNQRLLPAGWVDWSTSVNDPISKRPIERDDGSVQGRQWWLNRTIPGVQADLPWPDVPEDSYAALGHWGQSITVIPSWGLVIVRTADDRDDSFDRNEFLRLALAVAEAP